jgi:uncharacterized protein (TIGR04255 family)
MERLGEDYRDLETITEQGIQVVIGKDGPVPQLLPPRLKIKFKHASAPIVVQASQNTFVINALSPYRGWQSFRADILAVWPSFIDVAKPNLISRIGMRYINRIVRESREESPGYWLRPTNYLPQIVLSSGPNFMSRLEHRLTSSSRLVVTLAHDETNPAEHFGCILFDIDRIDESTINANSSDVGDILDQLHEDIWDVFSSAIGDRLKQLLKRGEKL